MKLRNSIMTMLACAIIALSSTTIATAVPIEDSWAGQEESEADNATTIRKINKEYPDGSYFTTTGTACENHNSCKWFNGARQCMGFARYCYYMYNDAYVDLSEH